MPDCNYFFLINNQKANEYEKEFKSEFMIVNEIEIPIGNELNLKGTLNVPEGALSLVIFSHGSGSSRFSKRNRYVAERLNKDKIATLLIDLLTEKEDEDYRKRFDVKQITQRLVTITKYIKLRPELEALKIGYFGASTGAASALRAAAELGEVINAIVSRGGRPDLAEDALEKIKVPVLLIVGSLDETVIELNQDAYKRLHCEKELEIVKGATHLFEEAGKLDEVSLLAIGWFKKYLIYNTVDYAF